MEKVREQIQIQKQKLKCGLSSCDSIAFKNSMNSFRGYRSYVCPNFCVDGRNREIMNETFLYLIGGSDVLNHSEGLWLYGSIGTGKSCILKIMQMYDRYSNGKDKTGYYLQEGFPIEVAAFTANQYCKKGIDGVLSYDGPNGITLGLDEIGREPKVEHYGTEMDAIQHVPQTRYDNKRSCTTFVTTNLFPEEIHLKYGECIADRANEMFNVVEIGGKSRR